jgi:hypothetical protein
MSTPNSTDVQIALLAYDAYNRGANPLLTHGGNTPLATSIGSATWEDDSNDILPASIVSDFSASYYKLTSRQQ